jgi:hypothetical protein
MDTLRSVEIIQELVTVTCTNVFLKKGEVWTTHSSNWVDNTVLACVPFLSLLKLLHETLGYHLLVCSERVK